MGLVFCFCSVTVFVLIVGKCCACCFVLADCLLFNVGLILFCFCFGFSWMLVVWTLLD